MNLYKAVNIRALFDTCLQLLGSVSKICGNGSYCTILINSTVTGHRPQCFVRKSVHVMGHKGQY